MHTRLNGANRHFVTIVLTLSLLVCFGISLHAQPFSVGRRVITYTDPARSNRSISTDLYYPADQTGNNVALAAGTQQFPIVVFGHGFVIPVSSYAWLADSLVKQGYVLALPSTESSLAPSHDQFGKDLAFLCTKLKSEGLNPASFLYQRIWPKAAVGGHSMGGGSSFLAAAGSSAIDAIFNFAAAETNPSATTAALSVQIPALVFSGSNDCIVAPSVQQSMYNNLTNACKTYVNITGALHCQFANNNGTCAFGQLTSGCNSSPVSAGFVFGKVQTLLLPFLDYFVKNTCIRGANYLTAISSITGVAIQSTCGSFPSCGVIPVNLVSFTGTRSGNDVRLNWRTASESDTRYFIVERNNGNNVFKEIARVKPRGNQQSITDYQVKDDNPLTGTAFYRLNILSADGRSSYSSWVRLSDNAPTLSFINVFPNPGQGVPRLTLYAPATGQANLSVYDALGSMVLNLGIKTTKGISEYQIPDLTSLASGYYRLVLRDDKGNMAGTTSWIKQ